MWDAISEHLRLNQFDWRDALTILVLWVLVYQAYRFLHATRGVKVLTGLIAAWILLTLVSELLDLYLVSWILKGASVFLALALVVIFQPELRRAVAELGSYRLFSSFNEGAKEATEKLADVAELLSNKRIGALIAVQRSIDLKPIMETGVTLDSRLSEAIIHTVFFPGTPLHDGGMVLRLRDERILAAGCVFPLNQREFEDRSIGLRHRAAMGVTEESDAIAVVVSEETGHISLAFDGKLERNLKRGVLRERLNDLLFEGEAESDESAEGDHRGSSATKKQVISEADD
jgi:diadenylate cyclase